MHDEGVVVGSVQVVGVVLIEVVGGVGDDVLPVDPDVGVAVTPSLLMLEAQSVIELVHGNLAVDAALLVE